MNQDSYIEPLELNGEQKNKNEIVNSDISW